MIWRKYCSHGRFVSLSKKFENAIISDIREVLLKREYIIYFVDMYRIYVYVVLYLLWESIEYIFIIFRYFYYPFNNRIFIWEKEKINYKIVSPVDERCTLLIIVEKYSY